MASFTCMHIDERPRTLVGELFEIADINGRQWLCRKELDNEELGEQIGGSEYAVGAYHVNRVSEFAESMGSPLRGSMFNPTDEFHDQYGHWNRLLLSIKANDRKDLARVLAERDTLTDGSFVQIGPA